MPLFLNVHMREGYTHVSKMRMATENAATDSALLCYALCDLSVGVLVCRSMRVPQKGACQRQARSVLT